MQRQMKREDAAESLFADHGERSTASLRAAFGNGKPQTTAMDLRYCRAATAIEGLEDVGQVCVGDSHSAIADTNTDLLLSSPIPFTNHRSDSHPAALTAVFHGI